MKHNNWHSITSEIDVQNIIKESFNKTQIIFKDSVQCGISAFAKERLYKNFHLIENHVNFNYLDLLKHRNVSNYIAIELKVVHQSPQVIALKNGEVIYRASHHSIEVAKILDKIINFEKKSINESDI